MFCAFKLDLSEAGKRQILQNFADMVDVICRYNFFLRVQVKNVGGNEV